MVSKNNHQVYQQKLAERKQRWGIRKLSVGVASVLLGTTFMLYSNHAVLADTVPTNAEEKVVATNPQDTMQGQDPTQGQDTTQDKGKQTNANETTQNTTKVGNEVMPANGVTTRKKFVRAALPV
ncbi:YSIRK-type signal peptide-containing protein [Ligilactobacillus salivarius]|uniref:YSIRK-type signal peptide-containing protein n=1 Tax=Ligilactobacillus salivarius TaxID=1624 RepID=UPI0020970B9D|nr:YSIRK-type signal peptide-containing protein [Ligilactobacillus salivarius]MCO7135219.1 YSIRK-type signal peptide-containing protein [Ligilactobacillus salivarius]